MQNHPTIRTVQYSQRKNKKLGSRSDERKSMSGTIPAPGT